VELAEPPPTDAATNDLAQRITATFRRTLPALRIASKWLKANFKYVLHESETANGKSSGSHTRKRREHKFNGSTAAVAQFWESYSRFASALLRAFPIGRLPSLAAPLEEDIDMRGFLPLRKMMGDLKAANVHEKVGDTNGFNRTVVPIATQVHPNEEQLMRIADLLDDAQTLAAMEASEL
jgi:hypothetical protein